MVRRLNRPISILGIRKLYIYSKIYKLSFLTEFEGDSVILLHSARMVSFLCVLRSPIIILNVKEQCVSRQVGDEDILADRYE
jgi:hypothetical protein